MVSLFWDRFFGDVWASAGGWVWCAGAMTSVIWAIGLKTAWDLSWPQGKNFARVPYHIRTIRVLASTAPLIGLLGTVSAMIHIFSGRHSGGISGGRAMAGGIAGALMSTQAGLLAAIPGLFIAHVLERRHARLCRKKIG